MSVTIVIPAPLRDLAGGRATVELEDEATTLGEVFDELRGSLPGLYDRIFDEQRELRPHVNVFVGQADIRWSGGLATPVADDSEVVILPSVSGG